MIRTFGKKENYKIVSKADGLYTIRWRWTPLLDEQGRETGYGYYSEHTFFTKPGLGQLKTFILNAINEDTGYKILTGFRWTVPSTADSEEPTIISCYLSQENQFNYKAAYDLAFQTQGASLPFRLKFGSDTNPQYYDFTTLEEIGLFYRAAIAYIENTISEGWCKR